MRLSCLVVSSLVAVSAVASAAQAVAFSDIQTWVGSGSNQAALVIDFSDGVSSSPTSLVWGYRWDGAATGEQMFNAVVAADPYLFTSVKIYSFGTAINGVGYDANKNGVFAVSPALGFDAAGYVIAEPIDGRAATDGGDLWTESFSNAYWSYWVGGTGTAPVWAASNDGISDRALTNNSWDGLSFAVGFNAVAPIEPRAAVIPEPAGAVTTVTLPLAALLLRRRRQEAYLPRRAVATLDKVLGSKIVAAAVAVSAGAGASVASAAVSASVVPGSLAQGATQSSLTGGTYAAESNNLRDWVLNTGVFGTTAYPVSLTNANFNGNSFGGTPNTMIAFGNGGGVTLRLDAPVKPVAGQKEIGLFTAQMLLSGSGALFNGNMEAAVLVSADGVNFVTLTGVPVASPTTYTAGSSKLNAPTVAYDFLNAAQAASYGSPGTTPANLAALAVASFETPMPDDNLFNGTGTASDRAGFVSSASEAAYDAVFGSTGGGNWLDISLAGLAEVNYVRLNAVNTGGGIRLDAVFANPAAVPEPGMMVAVLPAVAMLGRRRR